MCHKGRILNLLSWPVSLVLDSSVPCFTSYLDEVASDVPACDVQTSGQMRQTESFIDWTDVSHTVTWVHHHTSQKTWEHTSTAQWVGWTCCCFYFSQIIISSWSRNRDIWSKTWNKRLKKDIWRMEQNGSRHFFLLIFHRLTQHSNWMFIGQSLHPCVKVKFSLKM